MPSPAREWEALGISDDVLADILIRLPSLADLGRACATCVAFRRVVADRSFIRRVHALHPPSLLGLRSFYGSFEPVEAPHPSAGAGRALVGAAGFRFRFLPNPDFWVVRDALGGRFVLDLDENSDGTFTKIAVCDPLFQGYLVLPPIPDDLAAAVEQDPFTVYYCNRRCQVFLVPCAEEEEKASFSIIWLAQCPTKLVAFLFSSATSQWRAIAAPSWKDLNPAMPSVVRKPPMSWRSYAYGCFYWSLDKRSAGLSLVVLDTGKMEFSSVSSLGPCRGDHDMAAVELGERRLGIFKYARNPLVMNLYVCANHGEGAITEWVLQDEIPLPYECACILGVAEGKLILQTQLDLREQQFGCVSLDLKTLQLQSIRKTLCGGFGARPLPFLYAGYPLSLSLPAL
ncbi:hypothetical protein ACP70R_004525 [Stipagrostis hirtigluma subsp. patula]